MINDSNMARLVSLITPDELSLGVALRVREIHESKRRALKDKICSAKGILPGSLQAGNIEPPELFKMAVEVGSDVADQLMTYTNVISWIDSIIDGGS